MTRGESKGSQVQILSGPCINMKILFICKHNRFRSKVGEALMKKLGDGNVEVRGAGVKLDKAYPYVAKNVKIALREYGIGDVSDVSKLVTEEDKKWADKIIIVADNVNPQDFPSDKVVIWPTSDCDQGDLDRIKEIVKGIYWEVKGFLEKMAENNT